MATDTKQTELKRNSKGQIIGGTPPAGFNVHPENRNDGRWKKEDSISYNYHKIMAMPVDELYKFEPKTVAEDIALARVRAARDSRLGLGDAKEITDRTEGKAPQSIDLTTGGDKLTVALVQFVGEDDKDDSSSNTNMA